MNDLNKSDVWKASFQNTTIEIKRWSFDVPSRIPWKENWNFYIYLYEKYCKDFEALWLTPEIKSFGGSDREYISYDYYTTFRDVDMHGGITYYSKQGEAMGHRCVQIGCDYQHLDDEGQTYSVEEIYAEAKQSAKECVRLFYKEISK